MKSVSFRIISVGPLTHINYCWNLGFLLGITILLQIITGIFLGLHYTSDINSAYFSLFFLIRETVYEWMVFTLS